MLSFRVALADLLFGASCGGCGMPALTLCEHCAAALRPDPYEAWPSPTPFGLMAPSPVVPIAAGAYEGPLRSALTQYKEHGRFGLLRPLGHLLAASVCAHVPTGEAATLVPVPSSRRANFSRGYDAIGELAGTAARQLRQISISCESTPILVHTRQVADQSGLNAEQRSTNLVGALRLRREGFMIGPNVIIVDDIITTGATVAEAVRVLTRAGKRPIGIATIAATGRHHDGVWPTSRE